METEDHDVLMELASDGGFEEVGWPISDGY